nr:lipopolysaccharide biosynthesis protein [Rhizobium sp. Q54]
MAPIHGVKTVTANVGWSVLAKTATFGLKFVTVPILARLLSPSEFGSVAVALTIVQFLTMIGGAGLTSALIVEPGEDSDTVHSVFWVNLAMALLMSAGIYLWAAPLAALLGAPDSAGLLRLMAFLIPIQLSGDLAYCLLAKRMNFSKDAMWSTVSETLAAVAAVALAYLGFGVWALVVQLFAAALIRLFGLHLSSGYMPRPVLKPRKLRPLFAFSSGVMGSEIANFVTFQSPMIVIARLLGLADAGAYSVANRFASIPNQVVLSAVMGVLFPAFSLMGDDRKRRSDALMLSTQVTTVLLAPAMFGLWAVAEPAMLVIFGRDWAWAWPVLGLLALSKAIVTPCSTFIPYLKGTGHGRVLLWSAGLRAIATTAAIAAGSIWGGLPAALAGLCMVNAVTLVGYSWAVFRVDNIPFMQGLLTSSRSMLTALVMALCVRTLLALLEGRLANPYAELLVGAFAGGLIYAVLLFLTERALLRKLVELVRARNAAAIEEPA